MLTNPPHLALIVGAARSGTTLLRMLLDAHPEVGCPAEAGLPMLMANIAAVWAVLDEGETGETGETKMAPTLDAVDGGRGEHAKPANADVMAIGPSGAKARLSRQARQAVIEAVRAPMAYYCARDGKRMYCDKSLDSVYHLELVREVVPDVRCVLLFRHVLDTVASGLEASPWGFQAHGYAPFVHRWSGNSVAALTDYWLSHVSTALAWEEKHPQLCHRVRYEELVTEPARTLEGVFEFLGVGVDMSVLERAFVRAANAKGPGDYKVAYTSRVHTDSIGHGKRVPVAMIPPALLEGVNERLQALCYAPLGREWNAEPRSMSDGSVGIWRQRLAEIMERLQMALPTVSNGRVLESVALVAEDHADLRWVMDRTTGEIRRGDGEAESVLTGTAEDLALLICGQENAGVLLRSGRVRYLLAEEDGIEPEALVAQINQIRALFETARKATI